MSNCCGGARTRSTIQAPNSDVGFVGVDVQSTLSASRIVDARSLNGNTAKASPGETVAVHVEIANASSTASENRVVFVGVDGLPFYEVPLAMGPGQHAYATLSFPMLNVDVRMRVQLWQDRFFLGMTDEFTVHAVHAS